MNDNLTRQNGCITRRKAVKTIVGGVTAIAAYNMMPATWEKPIIEQIFLPAHAQTSGTTTTFFEPNALDGRWGRVSVTVNPDGSATFVRINRNISRRWQATFSSVPGSGTMVETATSSDPSCTSLSNPPGSGGGPSSTINLLRADANQVELFVGGGSGATFPLVISAGTIPAEPALTGSCTESFT